MDILNSINGPEDLKNLKADRLEELCSEIRAFLIENVAKTGGHLASNLGVVELTVALHRVYDTSVDRLIFDVGHQSYVHKLLTGRREDFSTLRRLDGISGFTNPRESIHDAAVSGHASNAVSLALGMARARTLRGEDYSVAALVGDGALTGGLAFEGLTNAGVSGEPLVVILNDNGMSIDGSVGGVARSLSEMRVEPGYFRFKRWYRNVLKKFPRLYSFNHRFKEALKKRILPYNMFYDLGFEYFGPVDGHDIEQLEAVLTWAKELNKPAVVHVKTQKGRGYSFAEENPEAYHGVGSFDAENGVENSTSESFSGAFGKSLCALAEKDGSIAAITASMCSGTGLTEFSQRFPQRFFDVGIAEGHAVTMAAGMAARGLRPVFAVYSSFLQRGYDMLIHDVALSGLHVVFAVDRAGIVGRDGETHQGIFDVSYLCSVPGMVVLCPASYAELSEMLELALYRMRGPVAVRFPRGSEGAYTGSEGIAPAVVAREGTDLTIITYGTMINQAMSAASVLEAQGISAEVLKLNLINPLDIDRIFESIRKTGRLLTAEEACSHGCVGRRLLAACAECGMVLKGAEVLDLGLGILPHGEYEELLAARGLDARGIVAAALRLMAEEKGE